MCPWLDLEAGPLLSLWNSKVVQEHHKRHKRLRRDLGGSPYQSQSLVSRQPGWSRCIGMDLHFPKQSNIGNIETATEKWEGRGRGPGPDLLATVDTFTFRRTFRTRTKNTYQWQTPLNSHWNFFHFHLADDWLIGIEIGIRIRDNAISTGTFDGETIISLCSS